MKIKAKIKKMEKILVVATMLFILFAPVFVQAQNTGLVPCVNNCGYADLLKLVNNIINWIIMISIPVAAGVFAFAGLKYMTTGVVDQKSAAKGMITKVFIGLVIILSAWIIINTLTNELLNNDFKQTVPIEGTK